jgi:hypothetical protein
MPTWEVEVLLQHSYLRARPVCTSVVCVTPLSHYPKGIPPGTLQRGRQVDSARAVWTRSEEKNPWPSIKKLMNGLLQAIAHLTILTHKMFKVSLFISYLHWYTAMERRTPNFDLFLRFLFLYITRRESILKNEWQINVCRFSAWNTCHDTHVQGRVKLSVHIL